MTEVAVFLRNLPVDLLGNIPNYKHLANALVDPHCDNTDVQKGNLESHPDAWNHVVAQLEDLRKNLLREAGQDQAIGDSQQGHEDHEQRLRVLEAAQNGGNDSGVDNDGGIDGGNAEPDNNNGDDGDDNGGNDEPVEMTEMSPMITSMPSQSPNLYDFGPAVTKKCYLARCRIAHIQKEPLHWLSLR